ncbi:hypothetical protein E2F50_09005 [Rhizobium deserti]|uniref:Uncharacterized protein n=1 Tax=Rhizobium deserti TaxID=2547961 RepID=A0A4R5UJI7_9HYPH|nr:hypothetical protein [Rhizobium deserti]TDK37031.1 hypothetical protein E2F50_09005 [Rhizobium deserti]
MDPKAIQKQCNAQLAQEMMDRRPGTSEVAPLPISPWLAMSLLQKSIRRNEVRFALQAAATLLYVDPERLWRRLICAAYEDIGLGDLDAVALVNGAMAGKLFRRSLGGDWAVASFLVKRLASTRKCRAADDLLMALQVHPAYAAERLSLPYEDTPDLMQYASGGADLIPRAIAVCYALGTDRWRPEGLTGRRGEPTYVFQHMLDAGYPHCVLELARTGFNRVREPLSALMSFVSPTFPGGSEAYGQDDDIAATHMVGVVPIWALDQYTREGREALRRFLYRDVAITRFIEKNVPPRQRLRFLGGLLFRSEGGLLRQRLQWHAGQSLRNIMEVEANGCGVDNATEALSMLRQDMKLLDQERQNAL